MKKSFLMGALLASTLCLTPAQAETPENTGERSEVLALMLAAYVSCDETTALQRDVRVEVKDFGSDFDETLTALEMVSAEQMACANLRAYAQSLVKLAAADPASFEALFGLNDVLNEAVPVEIADRSQRRRRATNPGDNSLLSIDRLDLPPGSGNLKTDSDYKP